MEFTNSGIPLLNESHDKHYSSLSINERNQLLDNKLGENQSDCISSTVDSLVDLDNDSSLERDEMVRKGRKLQKLNLLSMIVFCKTLTYQFRKSFSL